MILAIADVLDAATAAAASRTLHGLPFRDGRETAGWEARRVKSNLQADARDAAAAVLKADLLARIAAHPLFGIAARPARPPRMLLSRYDEGMGYGAHMDDALMGGLRTDLSFTLFLSAPEDYAGGALVIESTAGEQEYRLPAGTMLLYPTTFLHRVAPVERGTRLVAVGWVQSLVRDAARREMLFDLETAREMLAGDAGRARERALIGRSIGNLLRMWAEP
ncbi:Fe2+-dependent dioxygenase [Muricoccus radiodurans]|uniref:Fe2+-dependent dioxygenase n=1 Tax=Muricoccus radiodurans TaxID=2231721 RepID=UPI003CE9899C